jgi:hypothetical protein
MQTWVWRAFAAWALVMLAYDPADEPSTRERRQLDDDVELQPLDPSVRQRYLLVWQELQGRFVDDPHDVVSKSAELIRRVLRDRGYPDGDFEFGPWDGADTEELRSAFVHYRALFQELLQGDRVSSR